MPSDFTIEGRLKINDADLKRLPADVRRQTAKVQGTKAEIRTELNDTKAQADIMSLRRKVQYLSATGAYPKVALINGAKVNTDVIHIRNRMAHLSSTVARPKVVLSGDEKAIANIRGIRRELQKAGQGTVVPITTFPRVGVVSSPGAGAARGSVTTAAAGAGGMLAGLLELAPDTAYVGNRFFVSAQHYLRSGHSRREVCHTVSDMYDVGVHFSAVDQRYLGICTGGGEILDLAAQTHDVGLGLGVVQFSPDLGLSPLDLGRLPANVGR